MMGPYFARLILNFGVEMVVFEDAFVQVKDSFFGGIKVTEKSTGAIFIPTPILRERFGFVWMIIRKTRRSESVDPRYSEQMMWAMFAAAVTEPNSVIGQMWARSEPDTMASMIIAQANQSVGG